MVLFTDFVLANFVVNYTEFITTLVTNMVLAKITTIVRQIKVVAEQFMVDFNSRVTNNANTIADLDKVSDVNYFVYFC